MITSMTIDNFATVSLKLWKASMAFHQIAPCDDLLKRLGEAMAAHDLESEEDAPAWMSEYRNTLVSRIDEQNKLLRSVQQNFKPARVFNRSEALEISRIIMDRARRVLEDAVGPIEQSLADRIRERLLANSKLSNRVRNLCEDLMSSDLQLEPIGRNLRIRLNPEAISRISDMVKSSIAEFVKDDIDQLNGEWSDLREQTREIAIDLGDFDLDMPEHQLKSEEIINWLQPNQAVNFRYSGELPHRTFMDRISYGRRPVFVVMMLVSLVGAAFGAGRGLTAYLAPAILVLFVLGIVWTYHSFNQEREMLIERELARLRESLANELSRRLEELLKEWLNRATRWSREQSKMILRHCDDHLKAWADNPDNRQNESQRLEQNQQARIETILKALQEIRMAID